MANTDYDYTCAICHYYDVYYDECMLDAPCPALAYALNDDY